jgi:hypothetical protein
MSLYEILTNCWDPVTSSATPDRSSPGETALEGGQVLFLPRLSFAVLPGEAGLFTPEILGGAKNASFDPSTGVLAGTALRGDELNALRGLMRRFSAAATTLVNALAPSYRGRLIQARASFRPAEVAGRVTSWRKDDTRLHIDSFPATPSGGRRILRLFTNVNPHVRPRTWRIGDEFESVARRFGPSLRVPWPGSGHLLALARLTKYPRTPYDSLMLQLHDRMKADDTFQRDSPQTLVDFPAGTTWVAFTDQVSHAATAGQYQLEQTFLLPVDAMRDAGRSPLRVLEGLKGRRLA